MNIAVFDTERLIRKIKSTKISIKVWREQQKVYKEKSKDEFKLAFATFFLNRTNRSGIIEGGPIGGFDQTGNWKLDARFNKDELIKRLRLIKKFKKNITVTNLDGIGLLKRE